jgi:hypothetical protein
LTVLSAISVSSRKLRLPDTARVSTGAWSLSSLETVGGRMSRGRLRAAFRTFSRTSWAATSTDRSSANVMMMMLVPDPVMDRSSVMPWTVLTTSSIFCVTCVSISSTEAPGSSVRTLTVGSSTDGKRSTPSRK